MKIKGIPVGTTMPRPDWNQNNPMKADYIKNKPDLDELKDSIEDSLTAITSIPNAEDLDRLVDPGRYACETDETAKTLQACPVDKAFTLDVRHANGVGPYVGQELRPRDKGARLYRQFVDYSEMLNAETKALYDRVRGLKPQEPAYQGGYDIGWYDESGDYTLVDAAELYGFAKMVNEGHTFEGETVRLGADIIVNTGVASKWGSSAPNWSWTPIGNAVKNGTSWRFVNHFDGIFDGQGHYISGLYNKQGRDNGFMCYTVNATIKNLAIINSYFETDGTESASTTEKETGQFLATFVARGYGITLKNLYSNAFLVCSNKDWITGGIVGAPKSNGSQNDYYKNPHSFGAAAIDNVVFDGKITTNTGNTGNCVGGILGGTDTSYASVTNSLFVGKIYTNDNYVGGVAGRIYGGTQISKCVSVGLIDTRNVYGDLAGQRMGSGTFTLTDCYYSDHACGWADNTSGEPAEIILTGSKRLPQKCVLSGMMPTKWVKVYDSENKPTAYDVGAAPGGYGIGSNSKAINSLDEIDSVGWYNKWFSSYELPAGAKEGAWTFYVSHYGSPDYLQIRMPATYSTRDYTNFAELTRWKRAAIVNGMSTGPVEWHPWEWEHPPMELGVEYRTTERHKGKAVYVKRINFGGFGDADKIVKHGIVGLTEVVSLKGISYAGNQYDDISSFAYLFVDMQDEAVCTTSAKWTVTSSYVELKYTKS